MLWRAILAALLAACWLAACADVPASPTADIRVEGNDGPALWEIRRDGAIEGWLFGTIHALPRGTSWRTDAFDRAFDASDLLVLEISEYGGSFDREGVLRRLAITRGLPLPSQRLDKEDRPALRAAFTEAGLDERNFRHIESWAVALSLSSALSSADPAAGVDRILFGEASSRAGYRIVALEGAAVQLRMFDTLPQSAQLALLEGVAEEAAAEENETGRVDAWRTGDMSALEAEISSGAMTEPALRAALLDDRNRAWVPKIEALLAGSERPFVAVGAGHMLGDAALHTLLEQRGFTLRRIQ